MSVQESFSGGDGKIDNVMRGFVVPSSSGARILLVEDDQDIADTIIGDFTRRGYLVRHVADGLAGLEAAGAADIDLIIVDRTLPGLDGLEIVESLRRQDRQTPILILSALGDVDNRVRGLTAGSDDYLAKPFDLTELAARALALLRRRAAPPATVLRVGPLELDLMSRQARRGGRAIELLPREFKLLDYLMRHADQPVTRAMLLTDVWNYSFVAETNLVDVHISKLRKKLDAEGEERMLQGVRGVGFMLCTPK